MSAKKPPRTDEEMEEKFAQVEQDEDDEDDEDDDDDEADFVPDDDEDDDVEEEEEEEEEGIVPLFNGTLTMDQDKLLHWRGEGFHLTSMEAMEWNLLDRSAPPPWASNTPFVHTFEMEGTCDIETGSGNPTYRKIEVTWSVGEAPAPAAASTTTRRMKLSNGNDKPIVSARPKRGDDDDDDDDDDDADQAGGGKLPSLYYKVYGRQIGSANGDVIEFRGGYAPPTSSISSEGVSLVCQVRVVSSKAAVMASPAVAAAAKPAAARVDTEEDDDDEGEEADDAINYEELVALHEDAGLSVDALRKRYRAGGDAGTMESSSSSPEQKRGKPMPEDDDDDDYGF